MYAKHEKCIFHACESYWKSSILLGEGITLARRALSSAPLSHTLNNFVYIIHMKHEESEI